MKRVKVDTGADARRWDTYHVEVPDDWSLTGEEAEADLQRRIRADIGTTHLGTEYEGEHHRLPPDEAQVTDWSELD